MAPKVSNEYKKKRKEEILETALEVFKKKGFEPTTMQDIVDATGMSRGGLYSYFSSTDEIFREILEKNDRGATDFIDELIEKHEHIWDALMEYLNGFDESIEHSFAAVVAEYHFTGWHDHTRKDYVMTRYNNGLNNLMRLIDKGIQRGQFRPLQSVKSICAFMINTNDGYYIESKILGYHDANIPGQIEALIFYLKSVLQVRD